MDIQTLAALIQLAERAPLFAAERLWLNDLKAQVQKQLDEQGKAPAPSANGHEEAHAQAVG